jgi:hypothetical protein
MFRLARRAALVAVLAGCGSSGLTVGDAGSADTPPASPPAHDGSTVLDGPGTAGPDALDAGMDVDAGMDAPVAMPDTAPSADTGEVVDVPAADAPAADAGTATGKLCHELNRGGQPVVLTLELGTPPATRITAWTGRCAPPPGTPCPAIPAGTVPIRLFEGDRLLAERSVTLSEGQEYVFQPFISSSTSQVGITGGRIAPGSCIGLDFPSPDGGTD